MPRSFSCAANAGLHLSTGYSGHGFGIGLGAGRLTADRVNNDTPIVESAPFRYSRFFGGTPLKATEADVAVRSRPCSEDLLLRLYTDGAGDPRACFDISPDHFAEFLRRRMHYFHCLFGELGSDSGDGEHLV